MFVITADQHASREVGDLVPTALEQVTLLGDGHLLLPPERTAGDEFQVVLQKAHTVLDIVLMLSRADRWSVGVGAGEVEHPLPTDVRAARGSAFVNARDAVERAKKVSGRVAITGDAESASIVEALLRLLIELRDRRTGEGWEVYDLLAEGLTQRQIAHRLNISEGAVSRRVSAAALRLEADAVPALTHLLATAQPVSD